MEWAFKIFGPQRPIHISFDVDALEPREAPSTGTPVRGGLSFREGAYLCEYVHNTRRLVSMELVEVNPTLGNDADVALTMQSGISMVKSALGDTLTYNNSPSSP
jgi:arginase